MSSAPNSKESSSSELGKPEHANEGPRTESDVRQHQNPNYGSSVSQIQKQPPVVVAPLATSLQLPLLNVSDTPLVYKEAEELYDATPAHHSSSMDSPEAGQTGSERYLSSEDQLWSESARSVSPPSQTSSWHRLVTPQHGSIEYPQPGNQDDFPDNVRTIEHRFAGYLFRVRTDAEISSKKLRVKRVGKSVEYSCSGVLLTKIKYKLDGDIFSLYEDISVAQLKDTELCSKIEILMGLIVAGVLEYPWTLEDIPLAWGVAECEDIGDGNFLQVDVVREVDNYDIQSQRSLRHSPLAHSRPRITEMDAFFRANSHGRMDYSRRSQSHAFVDQSLLLKVLRRVELLTAMELGKRSHLSSTDVASEIGCMDSSLLYMDASVEFSAEVPTLFGLLVPKLSKWWRRLKGIPSMFLCCLLTGRRRKSSGYSYDIESFAPSSKDTVTSEDGDPAPQLSAFSGDNLLSPSYSHGDSGSGESEVNSDNESEASGYDPFAFPDIPDVDAQIDAGFSHITGPANSTPAESSGNSGQESSEKSPLPLSLQFSEDTAYLKGSEYCEDYRRDGNHGTALHSASASSNKSKRVEQEERSMQEERAEDKDEDEVGGEAEDEGETNSPQSDSSKNQDIYVQNHAVRRTATNSGRESQIKEQKQDEGSGVQRGDNHRSDSEAITERQERSQPDISSSDQHVVVDRNQEGGKTEEFDTETQNINDEGTGSEDHSFGHESSDTSPNPVSILRQPGPTRIRSEAPQRKVAFHIRFLQGSKSNEEDGRKDYDTRSNLTRDEWNEKRRKHLRDAYLMNPLRRNSAPVTSVDYMRSSDLPTQVSPNHFANPMYSIEVQPYKEAVAAGRIYDVPSYAAPEAMELVTTMNDISPDDKHGFDYGAEGPHRYYKRSDSTNSSYSSPHTESDSLPSPAVSRKKSDLRRTSFSRGRSRQSMHSDESYTIHNSSCECSSCMGSSRRFHGRKRVELLVAKDTFSVILGGVIVVLSILAIALDPAEEENWFKRIEEGIFVLLSLGVPLLLAMRSRLSDNLEIRMPRLTRPVRSIQDLKNMNKGMEHHQFIKQLQRALLLDARLSSLFSFTDACYKRSRKPGKLVVPERAVYRGIFRNVWFFGEELAYNKMLGKAYRYRREGNVLFIEGQSVDRDGIIVHVRRRMGKYTFGSTPEN